jgi:hypothetical protein
MFHSILDVASGGINEGPHLCHLHVVNLNDHPNTIAKIQHQSFNCQTLVFIDRNEHVTLHQTYDETFDVVLPKIRVSNLLNTIGKANKKTTSLKNAYLGSFHQLQKP